MRQTIQTQEEYQRTHGKLPLDVEGNIINIGDTVELIEEYYYPKGEQGIVRAYHSSDYGLAVEFSHYSSRGSHNLEGLLKENNGIFLCTHQVMLSKIMTPPDEETQIKNLLEDAKAEPKLALIDGKFYRLNLEPKGTANVFADDLMKAVSERISIMRAQMTEKIKVAEQKLADAFVFPKVGIDDIKRGMRVCKESNLIVYLLPLHYAPRYIGNQRGNQVTMELSEEHQKQLEQDILLKLDVDKTGKVYRVGTLKPDFSIFCHYHGNSSSCTGTIKLESIESPDEVFAFRDKLQKALTIINYRSLYDNDPLGLPTIEQLQEVATPIDSSAAWGNTNEVKLGAMVKILKAVRAPQETVGLIGKVVYEHKDFVSVEFLDSFPAGHNAYGKGKNHQCFDYSYDAVEGMPPETKRTRIKKEVGASPPSQSSTWATEAVTSPLFPSLFTPFASPEAEQFAKFGVEDAESEHFDIICRRCGERMGTHHGANIPAICSDDRIDGDWRETPHIPEAVPA